MALPAIIRPLATSDREWVAQRTSLTWGSEIVVVHGVIYHPDRLPGFIAYKGSQPVGLITYTLEGESCEVVTLEAWGSERGVGTALLEAVENAARQAGCRRVWLITTNDNTHALRFYQKRGLRLAAIHVNAVEASRLLKPEIPPTGEDGIPIRDEIELELWL